MHFLLISGLFRASSVGDSMVQASFQQNQEAKRSFQQAHQAQQLSNPSKFMKTYENL